MGESRQSHYQSFGAPWRQRYNSHPHEHGVKLKVDGGFRGIPIHDDAKVGAHGPRGIMLILDDGLYSLRMKLLLDIQRKFRVGRVLHHLNIGLLVADENGGEGEDVLRPITEVVHVEAPIIQEGQICIHDLERHEPPTTSFILELDVKLGLALLKIVGRLGIAGLRLAVGHVARGGKGGAERRGRLGGRRGVAILKLLCLKHILFMLGFSQLFHLLHARRPLLSEAGEDTTKGFECHQSPLLKLKSNGVHGLNLEKHRLPLLYLDDTDFGRRHACGNPKK